MSGGLLGSVFEGDGALHLLGEDQENLKQLFEQAHAGINERSIFVGFRVCKITFSGAQTNFKFQHGLGFLPKDILLTSKPTGVTVTFDQDKTTNTEIDITVTGAGDIRFLAGTFKEDTL